MRPSKKELEKINAELRASLRRTDSLLKALITASERCKGCAHSIEVPSDDYPYSTYYMCRFKVNCERFTEECN